MFEISPLLRTTVVVPNKKLQFAVGASYVASRRFAYSRVRSRRGESIGLWRASTVSAAGKYGGSLLGTLSDEGERTNTWCTFFFAFVTSVYLP